MPPPARCRMRWRRPRAVSPSLSKGWLQAPGVARAGTCASGCDFPPGRSSSDRLCCTVTLTPRYGVPGSLGLSPSTTVKVLGWSPRVTASETLSPGFAALTSDLSAVMSVTGFALTLAITSPLSRPAFSAGLSLTTSATATVTDMNLPMSRLPRSGISKRLRPAGPRVTPSSAVPGLAGLSASVTVRLRVAPSAAVISRASVSPGFFACTALTTVAGSVTEVPSTWLIDSPALIPAFSAGDPTDTCPISTGPTMAAALPVLRAGVAEGGGGVAWAAGAACTGALLTSAIPAMAVNRQTAPVAIRLVGCRFVMFICPLPVNSPPQAVNSPRTCQ